MDALYSIIEQNNQAQCLLVYSSLKNIIHRFGKLNRMSSPVEGRERIHCWNYKSGQYVGYHWTPQQ